MFSWLCRSRAENASEQTTRVDMTHRSVGDSVHVTLVWYLSFQFAETRPSSMRKKFLPRIISQALLQLRHDDLETMAALEHLRSTNWSHFKLLCLAIKWRWPIFGFSLLSPLLLLLHSRYVRWKEKKMKVLRILSFSRLWRYWMAIISFFLSPFQSRARFESGIRIWSHNRPWVWATGRDRKVSLTSHIAIFQLFLAANCFCNQCASRPCALNLPKEKIKLIFGNLIFLRSCEHFYGCNSQFPRNLIDQFSAG